MEVKELRAFSEIELKSKLEEAYHKLMELEFKRQSGVEKPHLFKEMKRMIARIHTIIKERERG